MQARLDGNPRNAIVILLDSLNRHLLGAYGSREFDTPNLDAFAARATRFDRHFSGSLPCMPARHDILCGALDFLWKPWGSIEIWEEPVTASLFRAGVTTMLISDHPHLFEAGGENYHTDFDAWEYLRGHESDPWRTAPDPSWVGAPALPARPHPFNMSYDTSRSWFREEADFPGPKTMTAAVRWLQENVGRHERFLLFVDEFDPHEPFDTPEPWASRYDDTWSGERLIWPPYDTRVRERGILDEREARHIRCNYGAKLSMIDHWLGKLLDEITVQGIWDDTVVILCTDHGHYLGEHDAFGKPGHPIYGTLGHTPLLVWFPGRPVGSIEALTTNVDLHATLIDLFQVEAEHRTHGRSLLPLLRDEEHSIRAWALAGIYGRHVHVIDEQRNYGRAPVGDNTPLAIWSNRWSTLPLRHFPQLRFPRPDDRASLDFMPGSAIPVIRQPFAPGDMLPYWAAGTTPGDHVLFDRGEDPGEERNLAGSDAEKAAVDLLRAALDEIDAPAEQFRRLGLSSRRP